MGNRNRAETEIEACLNEALLFATICIIGMPVDVHVRDGSVYSGTFHTASVDKEYGEVFLFFFCLIVLVYESHKLIIVCGLDLNCIFLWIFIRNFIRVSNDIMLVLLNVMRSY